MLFTLKEIMEKYKEHFSQILFLISKKEYSTSMILKSQIKDEINYFFTKSALDSNLCVSVKNGIVEIKSDNITSIDEEYYEALLLVLAFKYENPKEFQETFNYFKDNNLLFEKKEINKLVRKFEKIKQEEQLLHLFLDFEYILTSIKAIISSLKIGSNKIYKIPDINKFLVEVRSNSTISFGKSEFNLNYYNFDDESQKLLDVLYTTNFEIKENLKNIVINYSIADKIFDLYKGQNILFQDSNIYVSLNGYKNQIKIENEKLKLDIDGYIIKGYKNNYVIENNIVYILDVPKTKEVRFLTEELINLRQIDISDNEEFINKVYPFIYKDIIVEEAFIRKYPPKKFTIDSYFSLDNNSIILKYNLLENDIIIDETINTVFLMQLNSFIKDIEKLGFKKSDLFYKIEKLDDTVDFLKSDLSFIKKYGNVFIGEEIKNKKIRKLPNYKIKVKYDVDLLSFEFINDELSYKDIINVINSYKQKKKYTKLSDDCIIALDEEVSDLINLLEDYDLDYKRLGKIESKPYTFILKFLHEQSEKIVIDDKILEILNDLRNYKTANYDIPFSVKDVLRNYQIEGFYWLKTIIKHKFGGILADEMGLGKTLEIISLLMSDEINMPSVIVCPTSLIYNWCNEFEKWNSNIKTVAVVGSFTERERIINTIYADKKVIYVTSYDILRRDFELYNVSFRFLIADEAQFIKNQFAKKSEAIKNLNAEIKFSLTGTPIENSLADLWSIFDFVMPGYLSNYTKFKERYENLIMIDDRQALSNLVLKVTPFILRRTKADVLDDLPEKFENVYYVKMNDEQQKLYDSYYLMGIKELDSSNNIAILALLTRLRQLCVEPSLFLDNYFSGSAKIDLTIELISEYTKNGHKILLFSQFKSVFDIISSKLNDENINHLILTGDTKSIDRIGLVDKFNSNDSIKVFLISLKAGGTGLNLTSADTVIHLDPWWNVSVQNQATDRAHRIGQTKKVEVIKIICANSIEEKVLELQSKKEDLAQSIINNEEITTKLTKEDIKFILS